MKTARVSLAILLSIALVSTGCMTLISGGSAQTVSISSDPPGATAAAGGGVCRTPGVIILDRAIDHDVDVTMPGYAPAHARIESHWNAAKVICSVFLNACHGIFTLGISFAIGMVIDITSGSLQDLEPRSQLVPLMRWETAPIPNAQDDG